jgi:hypothetical protein
MNLRASHRTVCAFGVRLEIALIAVLLFGVFASSAALAAGPSPDPAPSGNRAQSARGAAPDPAPQAGDTPSAPSTSASNAPSGNPQIGVSALPTSPVASNGRAPAATAQSIPSISSGSGEVVAGTVPHRPASRTSTVSARPRKANIPVSAGSVPALVARELAVLHRRSSRAVTFRSLSIPSSRRDGFLLVLGALALMTLVVASTSMLRLLRRMNVNPSEWQV